LTCKVCSWPSVVIVLVPDPPMAPFGIVSWSYDTQFLTVSSRIDYVLDETVKKN
jgi:hypothetical protein